MSREVVKGVQNVGERKKKGELKGVKSRTEKVKL